MPRNQQKSPILGGQDNIRNGLRISELVCDNAEIEAEDAGPTKVLNGEQSQKAAGQKQDEF